MYVSEIKKFCVLSTKCFTWSKIFFLASKPHIFAGKRKTGIALIKEAITALQNRRMCLINSVHTCRSGIFNRKIRHRPISGCGGDFVILGLFYCCKKDFGVLIESCCGKRRDRKYAMWSLLLVPALRFIWFTVSDNILAGFDRISSVIM